MGSEDWLRRVRPSSGGCVSVTPAAVALQEGRNEDVLAIVDAAGRRFKCNEVRERRVAERDGVGGRPDAAEQQAGRLRRWRRTSSAAGRSTRATVVFAVTVRRERRRRARRQEGQVCEGGREMLDRPSLSSPSDRGRPGTLASAPSFMGSDAMDDFPTIVAAHGKHRRRRPPRAAAAAGAGGTGGGGARGEASLPTSCAWRKL